MLPMFIIGSGAFAVYALGYGIKGLISNNEVKQEITVIETPKKSKIIDAEYIEL